MARDQDHVHNQHFRHPWIDSAKNIRLLLIDNSASSTGLVCSLQVVPVAELADRHYCALSYTWGEARTARDVHPIEVDQQEFWVRPNLWSFFQSLKNFNGCMLIYIDAICLNQLDPEERGEQVKLMSEVYSHADQTHVWLGIPNLEHEIYLQTLRQQLDGRELPVSWQPDSVIGLSYLCSREYWRRLWIVQELLLSSEIVIYCGKFNFTWNEILWLANPSIPEQHLYSVQVLTLWEAWTFPRPKDFYEQQAVDNRAVGDWQFAFRLLHYRKRWQASKERSVHENPSSPQIVGLPFHDAMTAFKDQQCGDARDKVYALIGLLDTDGKAMITSNYKWTMQEVHVQAAAAGLVSRWRAENRRQTNESINYQDRLYSDRLNATLGLSDDDIEQRTFQALRIAMSYMSEKQYWHKDTVSPSDGLEDTVLPAKSAQTSVSAATLPGAPGGAETAKTSFQVTFENFHTTLSAANAREFAATDRKRLDLLLAVIQERQRRAGALQNMTRLRSLLGCLDEYRDSIDDILNVRSVMAFIWGPMKLLLDIASAHSKAFDGLVAQYEKIGETLPRFFYIKSLPDAAQRSDFVGEIFQNLFAFHKLALVYFQKPAWQQLFSSTWQDLEARLTAFVDGIDNHKKLIESQIAAIELEQSQGERSGNATRMNELLEHVKQARTEARKRFDEAKAHFDRRDADDVLRREARLLEWLSATDASDDQEHARSLRKEVPQSGHWLLQDARYRAWRNPDSGSMPLLWVTGKPGAGKSILASIIVDESMKLSDTTTLLFYCKHDDPSKNTFLEMTRSILLQLYVRDSTVLMYLFEVSIKRGERTLHTNKLAKEALSTCLNAVGKTHVIIDGIDECSENEQQHIGTFWLDYVEKRSSDCACVMLSRDEAKLNSLFGEFPTIRVQGTAHDADILSYCSAQAQQLQQKFHLSQHEKTEIETKTFSRAQGMFLYARLVMKNLSLQVTKAGVYAEFAPEVFPQGLDQAYARCVDQMLVQAHPTYRKPAKRLLAWLTCAARPLKWREIQAAISIDPDHHRVDIDGRQLLVDAKDLCGALVEELPNGDVTFVHSAVQAYLIDCDVVNVKEEQALMTELCLSYFCLPAFSTDCDLIQQLEFVNNGTYAFMEYALVSWTHHLQSTLEGALESGLPHALIDALDVFLETRWEQPKKRCKATKEITRLTDQISHLGIYEKVRICLAASHGMMAVNMADTEAVETLSLYRVLTRVRKHMEDMASQPHTLTWLRHLYGPQIYKCPRIYCKWFYEGFHDANQRHEHLERHERSHFCPSNGCFYATVGYPTAKELAKHVAERHQSGPSGDDFPDSNDDGDSEDSAPVTRNDANRQQPAPQAEAAATVPTEKHASRSAQDERLKASNESLESYQCYWCPARFRSRRAQDWWTHVRTHPEYLKCRHCSRTFSRP